MTGTVFATGSASVALNRRHAAPYQMTERLAQPNAISRGGIFYLYDRGVKIIDHRLLFTRVTPVVVNALLDLTDTVKATGLPFIWEDPLDGERSVFLTSSITIKEPSPDRLTVAMTVSEYINLLPEPYIGADGETLLMADGSEMRGAP